jgi:hypothetical protein
MKLFRLSDGESFSWRYIAKLNQQFVVLFSIFSSERNVMDKMCHKRRANNTVKHKNLSEEISFLSISIFVEQRLKISNQQ